MQLVRLVAAVVAVVVVFSGCTPSTVSTPSPTPTLSFTPSPAPTTLSPAEQDLRAAEQAVVAMVAKVDALAQDPTSDFTSLAEVARDQAFTTELAFLRNYATNGWVAVGDSVVVDPLASLKGDSLWGVIACVDVTGVDVRDGDGKSVVSPTRADRYKYAYEVVKDSGRFYVSKMELVATC